MFQDGGRVVYIEEVIQYAKDVNGIEFDFVWSGAARAMALRDVCPDGPWSFVAPAPLIEDDADLWAPLGSFCDIRLSELSAQP